jgi:hypothetical protein
LLGFVVTAERPEASSGSAGEDQSVSVFRSRHTEERVMVLGFSGSHNIFCWRFIFLGCRK